MLNVLKKILTEQNQFASGGLLLMLVGGIGVFLRAVPQKLWQWCVEQTTMTIAVTDEDAAFVWVKEWFLEQKFLKKIRRVSLDTTLRHEQLEFVPAPGFHWFWHSGRPFRVQFYRSEESTRWSARRHEEIIFQTAGRNQAFLKRFVAEIAECHRNSAAGLSKLYTYDEYWERVNGYAPRSLESVILRPGEKEHLIRDIEKFKQSKIRYRDLGVPYHRGYLFYGPPGTGKTSLVSALAARFRMSIYPICLADFNDKSLLKAVKDVPPNAVILFEDIDCVRTGRARAHGQGPTTKQAGRPDEKDEVTEKLGVTLSGLLNALDGFNAPENVLFVMTTNKVEVLDEALLRPGRIDYRLYLGEACCEQKTELYRRFFPASAPGEAEQFVEQQASAITMAQFQGLLLQLEPFHRDQPNLPRSDGVTGGRSTHSSEFLIRL